MKEFIYSRNAVYETLRAKRRPIFKVLVSEGAQEKGRLAEILRMARELSVPVEKVQRGRLDKVHENHQGVAAEVGDYAYSDVVDMLDHARAKDEQPFILLLDSLNDPQNFGTLLRTAEAVGVHGVVIPLAHTVEVTPAVVNASSGASEHLRVARSNLAQAIDALKAENVWVVGLDQNGETIGDKTRRHLTGPIALVVGSEGEGIVSSRAPSVTSSCNSRCAARSNRSTPRWRGRWCCIWRIWHEINYVCRGGRLPTPTNVTTEK
jgi:23S rRNA (guanosine2251-2'-O)-methyltransferase